MSEIDFTRLRTTNAWGSRLASLEVVMDTAQASEISRDRKNWYRLSSRILDKGYQPRGRLPKHERQALQDCGMHGAYRAYLNKTLPRQPPEGRRKTLPTNWWQVLLQLREAGVAGRKS